MASSNVIEANADSKAIVELIMDKKTPIKGAYMSIEYESGTHEYVNLTELIRKNSDGGHPAVMKIFITNNPATIALTEED